jgi:glycosyltransferase involved in cell wall biosynthesis
MREMYEKCHVVIVPTTTDFVEGFNKVVAEGILAGRPVITSSVCPALEYVWDGVVEVPPDDVAAYGQAIIMLKEDRALYQTKRDGCATARSQFYDPARSWGTALRGAIRSVGASGNG